MDAKILEQHMLADEKFQDEMRAYQKTVPTKDEISAIVTSAIETYFKNKGKVTFSIIVGSSIFIGALVTLLASLKAVLSWVGFHYIGR